MSESFVDLTYRGLQLGRRIKLTQIRPSTGYLELPMPMPVGTRIAISTDEGVPIDAVVTEIHEQVGGSDQVPGMTVTPALGEAPAASWWKERVALPELPPPEPARKPGPVVVHPRTRGATGAPPAGQAGADRAEDAGGTLRMEAVADSLLEAEPAPELEPELEPEPAPALDELAASADAPFVDDGKKTVMMESVDLSALGLDAGASGQLAAVTDDGGDDEADAGGAEAEGEGDGGGEEAAAAPAPPAEGDPSQPIVPTDRKKPSGRKRKKRR